MIRNSGGLISIITLVFNKHNRLWFFLKFTLIAKHIVVKENIINRLLQYINKKNYNVIFIKN